MRSKPSNSPSPTIASRSAEHLDDFDIADYLDDVVSGTRRKGIEGHTSKCASCREAVRAAEQFDADLSAALMQDFMAAAAHGSGPVIAERITTAGEPEVTQYLREIVMRPHAFKRVALTESPATRIAEVVRALCAAALEVREPDPQHSLRIAEEAASVARMLSPRRHDKAVTGEIGSMVRPRNKIPQSDLQMEVARYLVRRFLTGRSPHVGELSGLLGMKPLTLSRSFLQATGRKLGPFLRMQQIVRARRLLRWPGLSLSDVARGAGFERERTFFRAFRRATGTTPLGFR
jgi:AraC-like DNA-binding protein